MKTASARPALTQERCQHRTPTGRQCASRTLSHESSYCPRHSFAQPLASQPSVAQRMDTQPPDFQDFSALLTENASDFQEPQGINHSLAALYKLLACGQISPRRATGLAYIASLLLRTLPAIDKQLGLNEPTLFEIDVPARVCVGMSEDEIPPTPPELTSPKDGDPPACLPGNGIAPREHVPQQPPPPAAQVPAPQIQPSYVSRSPAVAVPPVVSAQPAVVIPPPVVVP